MVVGALGVVAAGGGWAGSAAARVSDIGSVSRKRRAIGMVGPRGNSSPDRQHITPPQTLTSCLGVCATHAPCRELALLTLIMFAGAGISPLIVPRKEILLVTSCPCTQAQLISPAFDKWKSILAPALPKRHLCDAEGNPLLHRKIWEWCFIAQALDDHGMLRPGKRGLGFAVGKEPLPAALAGCGCRI